jgi:hypothetical protein
MSQVLVAHTCNLSYLRGRDQKDCGSKLAWVNSSQDPISKIPNTKKGSSLPSKRKVLRSNSSTTKKKKNLEYVYIVDYCLNFTVTLCFKNICFYKLHKDCCFLNKIICILYI